MANLTREEAIKKGYLEKKEVILKPSPRKGRMVSDPNHVAYFMYEGATINFVLPFEKDRKVLMNVFKSNEEREYFESELSVELNPYSEKAKPFWAKFRVQFIKNADSMYTGLKFDLSEPLDNLRYRVTLLAPEVAPSWEKRFDEPTYRFVFLDSDYEETKASSDLQKLEEMFIFYGGIKSSQKKMTEFLEVYLATNKKLKSIPSDADKGFLDKEIRVIMDEDKDGFIAVAKDLDYDIKAFIIAATKVGAIEKQGINKYTIPGETTTWGLLEMVRYIKKLKDETDDTYLKIEAQINTYK
jgi:predicted DNA-binding ArsR family transcriptional regulator